MEILLEALFGLLLEILRGIAVPFGLSVGGAVAMAAFLWLATFPLRRDATIVAIMWLVGGTLCAVVYSMLIFVFPSLKGSLVLFLVSLIMGLAPAWMLPHSPSNQRYHPRGPYVVWVYFWFTALVGLQYGWPGLIIITLPALLIAGGGLFFVAGFLLPFPKPDLYRGERPAPAAAGIPTFGQEIQDALALLRYPENGEALKQHVEQRRMALRCLLTHALGTNYPYHVVIDEKITERTDDSRTWLTGEERLVKRVDGEAFGDFLSGPGIVLTGCDHAVVLSSGLKFKGAKGPGVVFTHMADNPTQAIDLRVQLRAFPMRAWTKDGIEVEVLTFIPFQIGTGNEKPELGKEFPYRSSAVFKAIHEQLVEHVDPSQAPENLKKYMWYDLPQIAGERIMREIVSRYEFDELYAPFELDRDPRSEIAGKLAEELDKVLPNWGIQRIGCGIGNLEPVDERVIEQRIEAWKSDWARKIMLQQAAGQSRRIQLVEQARAQTQIDLILGISERIEQLRASGAPIPMDVVALYFIEILEELAGKPALRRLLPGGMEDVIQRARGATKEEPASVEGG